MRFSLMRTRFFLPLFLALLKLLPWFLYLCLVQTQISFLAYSIFLCNLGVIQKHRVHFGRRPRCSLKSYLLLRSANRCVSNISILSGPGPRSRSLPGSAVTSLNASMRRPSLIKYLSSYSTDLTSFLAQVHKV